MIFYANLKLAWNFQSTLSVPGYIFVQSYHPYDARTGCVYLYFLKTI